MRLSDHSGVASSSFNLSTEMGDVQVTVILIMPSSSPNPDGKLPISLSRPIPFTTVPPFLDSLGSKNQAPTSSALSARSAPSRPSRRSTGNSDISTRLANSSSIHSLWVVMMMRMPALTAAANSRVSSTCIAGWRADSGSSIIRRITRLDDVAQIQHHRGQFRHHRRGIHQGQVFRSRAIGPVEKRRISGQSCCQSGSRLSVHFRLHSRLPSSSKCPWRLRGHEPPKPTIPSRKSPYVPENVARWLRSSTGRDAIGKSKFLLTPNASAPH